LNKYFKLICEKYFNSKNFNLQIFRFLFTSSIFYSEYYSDFEKNTIFALQNHSLEVIKKYYLIKHIFPENLNILRLKYLDKSKQVVTNKNSENFNIDVLKILESIQKSVEPKKPKKRKRISEDSNNEYHSKNRKKE
jgi:hypothetical protein